MLQVGPEARQWLEDFLAAMSRCLLELHLDVSFSIEYHDDHIRIDMLGEDSDGFLQKKAEALNALQHILRKCMERPGDTGEIPIVLDSHGYRRLRERELHEMARVGCDQVKNLGTEFTLGPLNPYERRIIHIACQNINGVITHSLGDGVHKRIVIAPAPSEGASARDS